MYKKSASGDQYINKSANWSLRGDRRGFNNSPVVVFDRKLLEDEPKEIRKVLSSERERLIKERLEIEIKIAPKNCNIKNWRANVGFKFKNNAKCFDKLPAQKKLFKRYFELGERLQNVQNQLIEVKESIKKNTTEGFLREFVNVAESELSHEEFSKIKNMAIKAVEDQL